MIKTKNVEINDLLKKQGIDAKDVDLTSNDVVVIPTLRGDKHLLSADDVYVVKKLREGNKKVHTVNQDNKQYHEFRGGEFTLAMMIVNEVAKPILLGLAAAWIYDTIKNYKEARKQSSESKIETPKFKLKYYFTKSKKYVEVEGDADEVKKIIDSLKDDEDV